MQERQEEAPLDEAKREPDRQEAEAEPDRPEERVAAAMGASGLIETP